MNMDIAGVAVTVVCFCVCVCNITVYIQYGVPGAAALNTIARLELHKPNDT